MKELKTFEAIGIFDKKRKKITLHIAVPVDDFSVGNVYNISSNKINALFVYLHRGDSRDVSNDDPTDFLSREIYYADVNNSITNSQIKWKGKNVRLVVFHDEDFNIDKAKKFHECFQNLTKPYDLSDTCHPFEPETSGESILVGT